VGEPGPGFCEIAKGVCMVAEKIALALAELEMLEPGLRVQACHRLAEEIAGRILHNRTENNSDISAAFDWLRGWLGRCADFRYRFPLASAAL
jgi:hypothetical protein